MLRVNTLLRSFSGRERGHIKKAALFSAVASAFSAYYSYRNYRAKDFNRMRKDEEEESVEYMDDAEDVSNLFFTESTSIGKKMAKEPPKDTERPKDESVEYIDDAADVRKLYFTDSTSMGKRKKELYQRYGFPKVVVKRKRGATSEALLSSDSSIGTWQERPLLSKEAVVLEFGGETVPTVKYKKQDDHVIDIPPSDSEDNSTVEDGGFAKVVRERVKNIMMNMDQDSLNKIIQSVSSSSSDVSSLVDSDIGGTSSERMRSDRSVKRQRINHFLQRLFQVCNFFFHVFFFSFAGDIFGGSRSAEHLRQQFSILREPLTHS